MKKIIPALLLGAVLGAAGTWVALHHESSTTASDEPPPGLKSVINPDTASILKQMTAVGLNTALPESALLAPVSKAYGRVLDPAPLISILAEISAGEAAASASAKEHARTKLLHDQDSNTSLQAVESAEAAMQRDRVAVTSAQARLMASWGQVLAKQSGLPALVDALATGDAALVRIDLLPGEAIAPVSARVSSASGEPAWRDVELLGPLSTVDTQSGGTSLLALWRTSPLRPGAALRVMLTASGEPQKVLVVPRSAVVRHQGGTFVYVQIEHGFERRLVTLGDSLPAGTVVKEGVAATDKIVVTGAQQMLSTEIMTSEEP